MKVFTTEFNPSKMVNQVVHVPTNSDFYVGIKSWFEPQKNTVITIKDSSGNPIESNGKKGDYTVFKIATDGKKGEDVYDVTLAYDSHFISDPSVGTAGILMPLPPQFKGKSFNCISLRPQESSSDGIAWTVFNNNANGVFNIMRNNTYKYYSDWVCSATVRNTNNSSLKIYKPDPFDYTKYTVTTYNTPDKYFTIPDKDGLWLELFRLCSSSRYFRINTEALQPSCIVTGKLRIVKHNIGKIIGYTESEND